MARTVELLNDRVADARRCTEEAADRIAGRHARFRGEPAGDAPNAAR